MIIINKFRFCILIVLCIIAFNYTSLTAQHPPCSGSVSIEVGTIVELEGGYNADIEITDPPADLEVVTLTVSITGDEVIILYKDDDSNKFNTNTNISSNLTDHVVDNVGDAYFLDPPQNFPSLNLSNGEILFTVPYSAIADSDVDIEITNALIYTDGAFCVPTTVDATNESVGHVDATGNIEKKRRTSL